MLSVTSYFHSLCALGGCVEEVEERGPPPPAGIRKKDRHLRSHFVFFGEGHAIVTDQLAAAVPTRKNNLKLIKPLLDSPLIPYSKPVHPVDWITITSMQIVFPNRGPK